MTREMELVMTEDLLEELYNICPEGGHIKLVWDKEHFSGGVMPFEIEREIRLVRTEAE